MNSGATPVSFFRGAPNKTHLIPVLCGLAAWCALMADARAAETAESAWRALPLVSEGRLDQAWCHVGWGGFTIGGDSLRTECDPKGLGLLVYRNERFGLSFAVFAQKRCRNSA
jgi:hypothetical protein